MNQLVRVGLKNGIIFNGKKIYIQSMLNAPAYDIQKNITQAKELEKAGCDILRVAIPTLDDVKIIESIKKEITIPIVADVHFDYRIAIKAVEAGVDKVRINPGNIGNEAAIKQLVNVCKKAGVPIRIGINGGSLEKDILKKQYDLQALAMVDSALKNIKILEKFDFNSIVISMKSSDVMQTIQAYKILRQKCAYPFHVGVTEAGTKAMSSIKSAIGIGSLLAERIGETIRVTMTDDPVEEVKYGHLILRALNLEKVGVEVIACPTCGRTKINIIEIAKKVEEQTQDIKVPIKVAIMGCVVNGPGEARKADIAVAGLDDKVAILFKNGEVCCKLSESQIVEVLTKEIFCMEASSLQNKKS